MGCFQASERRNGSVGIYRAPALQSRRGWDVRVPRNSRSKPGAQHRGRERENLYYTTDRTTNPVLCTTVGTIVIGSSRGAWRHIDIDKKGDAGRTSPTHRLGPRTKGCGRELHALGYAACGHVIHWPIGTAYKCTNV